MNTLKIALMGIISSLLLTSCSARENHNNTAVTPTNEPAATETATPAGNGNDTVGDAAGDIADGAGNIVDDAGNIVEDAAGAVGDAARDVGNSMKR